MTVYCSYLRPIDLPLEGDDFKEELTINAVQCVVVYNAYPFDVTCVHWRLWWFYEAGQCWAEYGYNVTQRAIEDCHGNVYDLVRTQFSGLPKRNMR